MGIIIQPSTATFSYARRQCRPEAAVASRRFADARFRFLLARTMRTLRRGLELHNYPKWQFPKMGGPGYGNEFTKFFIPPKKVPLILGNSLYDIHLYRCVSLPFAPYTLNLYFPYALKPKTKTQTLSMVTAPLPDCGKNSPQRAVRNRYYITWGKGFFKWGCQGCVGSTWGLNAKEFSGNPGPKP